MKTDDVIKYLIKKYNRALTAEEYEMVNTAFNLGEQNMFNELMEQEYSLTNITPISEEDKQRDREQLNKYTKEDFIKCLPFGEPERHRNICEECKKELRPDSSYYASDGDETQWYTDRDGSRLVCTECYCDLMAGDYSSMDRS